MKKTMSCILGILVVLIGVVVSLAGRGNTLDPKVVLLLKVGICGGFTTFSTFAYEIENLFSKNCTGLGILYALLSMILGTFAVFLGMYLCK